jgi:hypothetical protein
VSRTINVNLDYAPARWGHWAASLQWMSLSARVVTSNDQVELPLLSTLNVGVRYKLKLFKRSCSACLDAANVTDQTGLTISSLYVVLPVRRRNSTLTLASDICRQKGRSRGGWVWGFVRQNGTLSSKRGH